MANVIPFRGVLYNPVLVNDMARVVAPPYDVIDGELQRALHARHPNNVIRLELGMDHPGDGPSQNRYTRAASSLRDWLATGILRRDPEPAIYLHTIEFRMSPGDAGEASRVLKGFLATVGLEEFGTGRIFPHEGTRSAAKADRLKLLENCRANFSPIFSIFSDPDGRVTQLLEKSVNTDQPRVDFLDDSGFRQRLWAVTDRAILREIAQVMEGTPLFIADGHHRYETALTYRRSRPQQTGRPASGDLQPSDVVLMLCASLDDPGLTVLPTHRVLRTPVPAVSGIKDLLREAFEFEEIPVQDHTEPETRRRFLQTLRARGQSGPVFGLALRGFHAYLLLALRPNHRDATGTSVRERLDVSILQNLVLRKLYPSESDEEAIQYTQDENEALDLVRRGGAEAALLLNPTKVSEVLAVAASGERMPHKSTYFYPKPLTGLVMNVFED